MNLKNICKNFERDGYAVLPKFLSKPQIRLIFSQLNELINIPIDTINPNLKKKLSLDEKYLFLQKKIRNLNHIFMML